MASEDLITEIIFSTGSFVTEAAEGGGGNSGGGRNRGTGDKSLVEKVGDYYAYFASTVPWIALFCNSLAFLVFAYKLMHYKKEKNVNILLAGLALADTLSLVSAMDFGIYFWSDYDFSLMQKTEPGCRGIQYVNSIGRDCASYFILIFTLDRFVSVTFPLQKSIWITPFRVQIAMGITFLCAAIAEIYQPYLLRFHEKYEVCYSPDSDTQGRWTMIIRSTFGFTIPGIVVAILNGLIIRQLAKWSKQRAAMTGTETQNRTLTLLLVVISTYSFLVSLPKVIFLYYTDTLDSVFGARSDAYMITGYITEGLALLNHTCNFFFYCLSGSQFRRDLFRILLRLFTCGKRGAEPLTGSTTRSTVMTSAASTTRVPMTTRSEGNGVTDSKNQSTTSLSTVATVVTP